MKRFTETNKWRDLWFRKLSLKSKALFLWLADNCDNSGVIEPDLEAASFDIGEPIEEKDFTELQSRLQRLPSGKMWLTKFIAFQYGTLSSKCVPHLRVLELIQYHELSYPFSDRESTRVVPRVETTLKTGRGQEEEGGCGGNGLYADTQALKALLNSLFKRNGDGRWSQNEESLLCDVAKNPDFKTEFDILRTYRDRLNDKDRQFFPQSVGSLLEKWQPTLDRAKSFKEPKLW